MDDSNIISLFRERDETAIKECDSKYGDLLRNISYGVLGNIADSEEVANDSLLKAWESIPPNTPGNLRAYLCKIARNISINRWNERGTKKRGGDFLLTELTDCIPSGDTVESAVEAKELSAIIAKWLRSLPKDDRVLFMRRYFFGESLDVYASEQNKVAGRLYRLRQKLKKVLEKEGIIL